MFASLNKEDEAHAICKNSGTLKMFRNVDRKKAKIAFLDKVVSKCSLELTGSQEVSS
jgi:hypothetical protein